MIARIDIDELADKVFCLPEEHGIVVENGAVSKICLEKGCTAGRDHPIKIPGESLTRWWRSRRKAGCSMKKTNS